MANVNLRLVPFPNVRLLGTCSVIFALSRSFISRWLLGCATASARKSLAIITKFTSIPVCLKHLASGGCTKIGFFTALIFGLTTSASADYLAKGEYAYFPAGPFIGGDYQVSFNYDATACNTFDTLASCCILLINKNTSQPNILNYSNLISSRQNNQPLDFVSLQQNQAVSMAVYGVEACQFSPPVITQVRADPAFILAEGRGQILGNINLTVSQTAEEQPRYILRDISRRLTRQAIPGNPNQGKMAADAEISTRTFVGFNSRNNLTAAELLPVNSPIWNSANDSAQVDAHYNSTLVYDYLLQHLAINSFDDKGSSMLAQVDVPFPAKAETYCGKLYPSNSFLNAFWNGYDINFTPRILRDKTYDVSFAAALDVTAHEWGHALSEGGANLSYEREPGALNEAYSDWLGIAVKFAKGNGDWIMGSNTLAIRDIADPKRFSQPDTYKGEFWEETGNDKCPIAEFCTDYCGVHANSGVANKMFYLLAVGGVHNGVTVEGLGIETAIKIATDAVRFFWSSRENFLSARLGMQTAATSYGANAVAQVNAAWRAVGVLTQQEQAALQPPVTRNSSKKGGAFSLSELYWMISLIFFYRRNILVINRPYNKSS